MTIYALKEIYRNKINKSWEYLRTHEQYLNQLKKENKKGCKNDYIASSEKYIYGLQCEISCYYDFIDNLEKLEGSKNNE